uniref:Uncharacterized protein n=1 Tax=Chromera velia CCMP2878 TaxID=1169474 RepID=A0A0G4G8L8_9ALVE|eukprot:Cvel_20767.t1-p1 / transcript=Cvel_20767.t1 / gene=Cvel_20767 / organism=Chromera_velia_CCMP2878 / gene_product=hypothetical protein / transcript_product=hypothetical protein / location=Cvel_scaffold1893:33601-34522(+) / protein_length=148 / sequence_SO=supercontig / SO=protein_coding / is_pseudo=false
MFSTKTKTELKELGFEEIDESIHVQRETNTNEVNAVIYHHVDDFEGGAMDIEEIFSKYGHRLSLGSLVLESDDEWNLVACGSKRTKQKFISSTSCEMASMVDGVKAAYKTRDIAFRLFGKLPRVIVVMDSKPLYDQIESGLARSEPRM